MKATLTAIEQRTYDAIMGSRAAHDVQWRDIRELLQQIGEIAPQANGNIKATCNGQSVVLHPPGHPAASMEELMSLRQFIERAQKFNAAPSLPGAHLLVVLDHREARVYRTENHGSEALRIVPYDPHGFGRDLRNVTEEDNGQRQPERKSFYNDIIQSLRDAGSILLFGGGTGESSAMAHLAEVIRHEHPELARKIVGEIALDTKHLTEDQILASARAFYAARQPNAVQ